VKTTPHTIYTALALFAFASISILPAAKAVVPAPDGGYPGFNTAEGTNALKNLTTGVGNAAVGWYSLFSNTDGSFNTALGAGTLLFNVGDQSNGDGTQNTAIGAGALLLNTTGFSNTADGAFALFSNTEGSANTANGDHALYFNETGYNNAAFGASALLSNTTGFENTANGTLALYSNTQGFRNTAVGASALFANAEGAHNNAFGDGALASNVTGNFNNAFGSQALVLDTVGARNSAFGDSALFSNTGSGNTAIGNSAGSNLTAGDRNICIGDEVRGVAAESNRIRIGDNLPTGSGESACYIGGIAGQTVGAGGGTCYVDNAGKLGVFLSARRYKENIQPMDDASRVLFSLKPVTFCYRPEFDKSRTPHFGLVAEEVAKVSPELVTHNAKGELSTVRYEAVNAMLLNEFLKEHRKVQELEATIARLKSGMDSLIAHIKQQDSKIQKVADELEMRRATEQVAAR